MVSEIGPDFVRLHERVLGLAQRCERLTEPPEEGFVRWLDVSTQLRMIESPLDIAATVRARLLGEPSARSEAGCGPPTVSRVDLYIGNARQ
jgi:ATP-dependent DNA helicase DinG